MVLLPRAHDLGGFEVRRALPAHERQMVGPFIFFDQVGPGEFLAGDGLDFGPHLPYGLATVTYLFEGEILHRDSLLALGSFRTARRTLAGYEAMATNRKGKARNISASDIGAQAEFIATLFQVAA